MFNTNIGFKAMQLVDFKLLKTAHLCNEDDMKHEWNIASFPTNMSW